MTDQDCNFAYLDEQTKRMIRSPILKGVAVPEYQVPFASREMPMPYGWGTGAVQVTVACLTPDDTLKVIDLCADDTTNAVLILEPLRFLEPRETETRKMHELHDYGLMHVKLYEDIAPRHLCHRL